MSFLHKQMSWWLCKIHLLSLFYRGRKKYWDNQWKPFKVNSWPYHHPLTASFYSKAKLHSKSSWKHNNFLMWESIFLIRNLISLIHVFIIYIGMSTKIFCKGEKVFLLYEKACQSRVQPGNLQRKILEVNCWRSQNHRLVWLRRT